jgi:hypothetical protein
MKCCVLCSPVSGIRRDGLRTGKCSQHGHRTPGTIVRRARFEYDSSSHCTSMLVSGSRVLPTIIARGHEEHHASTGIADRKSHSVSA